MSSAWRLSSAFVVPHCAAHDALQTRDRTKLRRQTGSELVAVPDQQCTATRRGGWVLIDEQWDASRCTASGTHGSNKASYHVKYCQENQLRWIVCLFALILA